MITPELLGKYAKFIRDDFKNENEFEIAFISGSTYIKVIAVGNGYRCAHSFIVAKTKGKFREGDILKAASWKTPAKNYARATLFDPLSWHHRVTWTGVR